MAIEVTSKTVTNVRIEMTDDDVAEIIANHLSKFTGYTIAAKDVSFDISSGRTLNGARAIYTEESND
jgi:hypothetical protein